MGIKIMTVDDSASVRMLVGNTLRNSGYEVIEASNGQEALEILEKQNIDLLLADVHMTPIDGIELVRQVRLKDSLKYIPIVMLTTEISAAKKFDGVSAGATGWITKPFDPEELLKVVQKVLR